MDDGIELNFASSLPDSVTAILRRQAVPKKGGRWTDRAKARKAVRRTAQYLSNVDDVPTVSATPISTSVKPTQRDVPDSCVAPPNATINGLPYTESRPANIARTKDHKIDRGKRLRHPLESASAVPQRKDDSTPTAGPSRIPASQPAPPKTSKAPQIISSLFSFNPATALPETSSSTSKAGAPSNAPLTGDTSTFEGLGLDSLLRRHLKGKMSLDRPTGIQRSALPYMLSSPLHIDRQAEVDADEPAGPLRDIFIQSQTGSGKTLSYLLPIIQTLLPLSRLSYIDRSIGTLAIILAPTRELAKQISTVLEQILSLSLSSGGDEHMTRWLVSGLLTGGSTKTHEKARLRKGVPILVSTPGRLLDHLQNTASFNSAKTLFLVLDEADRLMDLGFEETITGIIKALDGRRKIEIGAEKEMEEEGGGSMRWPFWARGRRTVLCSATVDAKVERLSGTALRDPVIFRDTDEVKKVKRNGIDDDAVLHDLNSISLPRVSLDKFTPPSQLQQRYVITPTKLRLVALVALLRSLVAAGEGTKVIVFLSSTDTVDFHWSLLGGIRMGDTAAPSPKDVLSDEISGESTKMKTEEGDVSNPRPKTTTAKITSHDLISLTSPLFPSTTVHRLHGSLPLRIRNSSLAAFSEPSTQPSILLATSVASRGLDLPLVRAVIQYDLPTVGGANEYVHRVGRTARAGKGGEAWAFVAPSEADWVGWVEGKMGAVEEKGVRLSQVGVEDVLKKGFGGKGYEYEARATDVQLAFERWVLASDKNAVLARKAFGSFVRAYSTHPLEEKKYFHPKSLHLGHLAKSFALRETPGHLSSSSAPTNLNAKGLIKRKRADEDAEAGGGKESGARNETEKRMYAAVRKAGRATKSGGEMGEYSGIKRGTRAGVWRESSRS